MAQGRDAGRRPLIVVSNRGPVTYGRDADRRAHRASRRRRAGDGAARAGRARTTSTWIASATTDEDRVVAAEGGASTTASLLLAHDPVAYDRYYNVIANPLLWFIQHSLWGLATAPDLDRATHEAWSDGYVAVNERVRRRGCCPAGRQARTRSSSSTTTTSTSRRASSARRARRRRSRTSCTSRGRPTGRCCRRPWRDAIYDGLLANDVVGFQTERWAARLPAPAVAATTGSTLVTHHPISVDAAEFDRLSASPAVLEAERALLAARPEKLIVRVDRTDPSKNIVRGFKAFRLLLEEHPEWHGRVTMLALLDPSRQSIPEYVDYLAAVEREAHEINERYGTEGWLPVDLQVARRLPALGRRLQAVRRAVREPGLRRAEPRREGGAARQHARRRARPLRERRRPRGARRLGALGQPVRRRRPGRRAAPRADDGRATSGAARRGDPRARSRQRRQRLVEALLADVEQVSRNVRP